MQDNNEKELYETYWHYIFNDNYVIPKIQIEMPLYRYRGNIDFAIGEIKSGNVYMAPIYKLNDPFDASYAQQYEEALNTKAPKSLFYNTSYFLLDSKWNDDIKEIIEAHPEEEITLREFGERISQLITEKGDYFPASAICKNYYKYCSRIDTRQYGRLACFSENWNSIPMWAYYANSHKGVCIKYDFSLLDKKNIQYQNIMNSISKVWYSETRPVDKQGSYSPFVKGLQWAHEQEWRLFQAGLNDFVNIPCITEVYLGHNMDSNSFSLILNAIKESTQNITPYMMIPKPDEYSFQKLRINMK